MSSFFADTTEYSLDGDNDGLSFDSDEDIKDCPHDIIVDSHCQLCGLEIFGRCSIVNEDINSFDGPKCKKIVSNDVIISAAQELPLNQRIKNTLINHIESFSIQLKNNKDTTTKLLCIYGFKFCIQTNLIECTPNRFFEICGAPKNGSKAFKDIMKYLNKGILGCDTISYIHPIVYIKEFLYVMRLKKSKEIDFKDGDIIPIWYENIEDVRSMPPIPEKYIVPPGHEDIITFCEFLLSRREVIISNASDEVKEDMLAGISHHFTYGDSNTEAIDKYLNDYDYLFELPQRIAATTLYNVLMFSLDNLMNVDHNNKILKVECGEPIKRLYDVKDLHDYYGITESAFGNLIKKMGIRCMHNRNKKKIFKK